ncbi:LLM class flavin-dependent oxidoreductase [Streptomyces lividans]|uniref:LLM class flavin-dependent oxidoreductase n=1 Tax=Streptomyces lividans TaxID=1916 RepID=UPI00056A0C5C|nr:LLM class flavin-dependent oxidoreductase [Streptomyces lividans]
MDTTGVAAAREDAGPLDGPLRVARRADRPGHREVWLGEGPTWDAFVLAAAAGAGTRRIALTAGPDRRPGHRTGPDGGLRRHRPDDAYAETGPDEPAPVPATAGGPGGERTLTAPAP